MGKRITKPRITHQEVADAVEEWLRSGRSIPRIPPREVPIRQKAQYSATAQNRYHEYTPVGFQPI